MAQLTRRVNSAEGMSPCPRLRGLPGNNTRMQSTVDGSSDEGTSTPVLLSSRLRAQNAPRVGSGSASGANWLFATFDAALAVVAYRLHRGVS